MCKSILLKGQALIMQLEHEKCLEMIFLSNVHIEPTLMWMREAQFTRQVWWHLGSFWEQDDVGQYVRHVD